MVDERELRERDLREAIATRRYGEARAAVLAFCAAACAHADALPRGSPARRGYLASTLATLEWAHRMTATGRALLQAELSRLPRIHPSYRPPAPPPSVDVKA